MNISSSQEENRPLGLILAKVATVIALTDLCFWKVSSWGFSEALFFSVLLVVLLLRRIPRGRKSTVWITAVLSAGAAMATVIEPGVANTFVWILLTLWVAAVVGFSEQLNLPAQLLALGIALVSGLEGLLWITRALAARASRQDGPSFVRVAARVAIVLIPTLILVLIFGTLLGLGNAVFGSWASSFFGWLWDEIKSFFDLPRLLFWILVGCVSLPLLKPWALVGSWAGSIVDWVSTKATRPSSPYAALGAIVALVSMNLLFLIANGSDAVFLWAGTALPPGMTFTNYVHQGVEALVGTVLLSAVVLVGLFHLLAGAGRSPLLRTLGLAWIVQNAFLILSIADRLRSYIQAYDMTVDRLSLVIFLCLVATGFALLAIKIIADRSIIWLMTSCLLAVFFTFYITQFLNLAGWSADFNEARCEKDRSRSFDMAYLCTLGPSAWPAMARATQAGLQWKLKGEWPDLGLVDTVIINERAHPSSRFDQESWREFCARAWWNRRALDVAAGE